MTAPGLSDLRASVAFFSRLPVAQGGSEAGAPRPRGILLAAPAVGLLLGAAAAAVGCLLLATAGPSPAAPWIAATATIATLAYLTRGLHLDGLADLADGLGSAREPAGAVSIMQRSDIGPFGVITLVLVLVLQVLTLGSLGLALGWQGLTLPLAVAALAGRLAAVWLCRTGTPAAPGSQLGAWVAGCVPTPAVAGLTALCWAAASGLLWWTVGPTALWAGTAAVGGAVLVGLLVLRTARRRFAGITGDVLGAAVELGQTAALLALFLLLV